MENTTVVDAHHIAQTSPHTPVAPLASATPLRYGGFWVRWAAHLLDGWIAGFVTSIILAPFSFTLGLSPAIGIHGADGHMALGAFIFLMVFSVVLVFAYYIVMTHRYGATLGKMAVGLRVCADDGSPLSLGNIAVRETVGKFISGVIFNIGFLVAAFTDRKRALHDMIVHSVVVYKDPVKGPNTGVVAVVYIFLGVITAAMIALLGIIIISGALWMQNTPDTEWDEMTSEVINGIEQWEGRGTTTVH